MRRLTALAILLAGCAREPALPPGLARYEAPDRSFSTTAPAAWRVDESRGGTHRVSLYAPDGVESVAIYFHGPGSAFASPAAFAAAKGAAPRPLEAAGRAATEAVWTERAGVHGGPDRRLRAVLLPGRDGFWALVHAAPAGSPAASAAFDAVLAGFKAP